MLIIRAEIKYETNCVITGIPQSKHFADVLSV